MPPAAPNTTRNAPADSPQEDAERVHWHAILVAPIKAPKLTAAAAVVEVLNEGDIKTG